MRQGLWWEDRLWPGNGEVGRMGNLAWCRGLAAYLQLEVDYGLLRALAGVGYRSTFPLMDLVSYPKKFGVARQASRGDHALIQCNRTAILYPFS